MGVGARIFIFDNEAQMQRISHNLFHQIYQGDASLPEYTGQRTKYVYAYIENQNRQPVRLVRIDAFYLKFLDSGYLDEDWKMAELEAAMAAPGFYHDGEVKPKGPGNILDISEDLAKRGMDRFRWKPTSREVTQIVEAIWPKKKYPGLSRRKVVQLSSYKQARSRLRRS